MLDDKHEILAIVAIVGLVAIVSVSGLFMLNTESSVGAPRDLPSVKYDDSSSGDITGAATATNCCYYTYEGTATVVFDGGILQGACSVPTKLDDPFNYGELSLMITQNIGNASNSTNVTYQYTYKDSCGTFYIGNDLTPVLVEPYCNNQILMYKRYTCSKGCQNGACMKQKKLVCPSTCPQVKTTIAD